MDISSSCTAAAAATVKTPEAETETPPTRIYPAKPLSYSSNGVLKRLNNPLHDSRRHAAETHHAVVVNYRECLKNHAAPLGGHAVDGCGEFMPSPTANPSDPTSLKCAACGCHRNFHRREHADEVLSRPDVVPAIEYQPYHRHHPPPPQGSHSSPPSSPSPPPISSSYYPSAPHVLLALSTGMVGPHQTDNNTTTPTSADHISGGPGSNLNGRKRIRTKFTADQKEKMFEFAERVGWKIQKRDEDLINNFCSDIGVERVVFKVWMHNNKNISGKRDHGIAAASGGCLNYNDSVHGMNFNLLNAKSQNLDSTAAATATACQFDIKNENNGVTVPLAAAAAVNGSYYSS